jgi:hypothetical protein
MVGAEYKPFVRGEQKAGPSFAEGRACLLVSALGLVSASGWAG